MNGFGLLLLHAASTLFMTGLIWFVQIVHYPLFAGVGAGAFAAYANEHARLTTWLVAPPMLVEMATAALLLWRRPAGVSSASLTWGLGALLLVWASTWLLQVPQHQILSLGFDLEAYDMLVAGNWVRTAVWSLRSLLVLMLVARAQR